MFEIKNKITQCFIMVECTFFEDELVELANQSQHIHWKQLRPIFAAHPNITFMLMHFSMRYTDMSVIEGYVQNFPNVRLWTN